MIDRLQRWQARHDLVTFRVLRSQERRLTQDGGRRRPIEVLHPLDAHELYQSIHLERSCILSQGKIFVLRDPRRDPPTKRDCIPLSEFVSHKGNFGVVEDGRDPVAQAELLLAERWTDCAELKDPRIIPHHIFGSRVQPSELIDETGRMRFRRTHQVRGGVWESPTAGTWKPADPRERHGAAGAQRSALYVGEFELPGGFHWDATNNSSATTVTNSRAVWKVERHGYLNIYPDAHIRHGGRAKEWWQAKR
ncbi:hypothetical protein [Cellulosimicrobium sp. RS]|uniref:hypothetical protein n=1 Tax=Cellulosimicrobium sp. RS TaxID=3381347 RepID=UPI0038FCBE03